MRKWFKRIFVIMLIVPVLLWVVSLVYEPAQCGICGQPSYQMPCVVDIATGEVTPFPDCSDKAGCGMDLKLNTSPGAFLNPFVFCRNCRKQLPLFSPHRLVLADLHDPPHSKIYLLADSAVYYIGNYCVNIRALESGEVNMTVTGTA